MGWPFFWKTATIIQEGKRNSVLEMNLFSSSWITSGREELYRQSGDVSREGTIEVLDGVDEGKKGLGVWGKEK